MDAKEFLSNIGRTLRFEDERRIGFLSIKVLPELNGKPFDNYALGMIQTLRPSFLRVCRETYTLDALNWRVTVFIDEKDNITKISQEVEVGLPEDYQHGSSLKAALKFGKDSEEHKWNEIEGNIICLFGYTYKIDKDGKEYPYPNQSEDVILKAKRLFEVSYKGVK